VGAAFPFSITVSIAACLVYKNDDKISSGKNRSRAINYIKDLCI